MKKVFMFVLAMALAMFATSAMAQSSTTGSIEGIVTDPNGAAVKGATVTATSPNLITPQSATSGDDGRYLLSALPPGIYKVTVDASGFGKYEKGDVSVNLGKTSTVDPQLNLATATATVTVTGGAQVDLAANSSRTSRPSARCRVFTQSRRPLPGLVCAMRPAVIAIRRWPDRRDQRTTTFWMA